MQVEMLPGAKPRLLVLHLGMIKSHDMCIHMSQARQAKCRHMLANVMDSTAHEGATMRMARRTLSV